MAITGSALEKGCNRYKDHNGYMGVTSMDIENVPHDASGWMVQSSLTIQRRKTTIFFHELARSDVCYSFQERERLSSIYGTMSHNSYMPFLSRWSRSLYECVGFFGIVASIFAAQPINRCYSLDSIVDNKHKSERKFLTMELTGRWNLAYYCRKATQTKQTIGFYIIKYSKL